MGNPKKYVLMNIDGELRLVPLGGHFFADMQLKDCMLHHLAEENEQLRAEQKPTYKEVYARYRRRHARNPKVTIREVCEEMGVDYDNIRAAKSRATKHKKRHDKRHKQGPK